MDTKGRVSLKREPRITNRIRWCRMAVSLSQKDLAFLMDLPWQEVSRWERGGRIPNLYNAIGLAVATKKKVNDLFLDYDWEWKEKVREREELLNQRSKKSPESENSKNDHER